MAFGDPGYDVVFFDVRVVEVERLIQVVKAWGLSADDKGIERIVVPHLRQAEDESAVAGDVLYAPFVGATGAKSEAADEKPCDELCFVSLIIFYSVVTLRSLMQCCFFRDCSNHFYNVYTQPQRDEGFCCG